MTGPAFAICWLTRLVHDGRTRVHMSDYERTRTQTDTRSQTSSPITTHL